MTIATLSGATNNEGGIFDAADAFLTRIEDKGAKQERSSATQLPEENEQEHEDEGEQEHEEELTDDSDESPEEEEGDDEGSDDDSEDTDDEDEEGSSAKAKQSEDDVIVKIKVDGKELDVPVKDLKRLYGQEAALTRKSQEVAAQRKQIEEIGAKQTVALSTMLQRAQERAQPYAQIDFLALAKDPNISAEELTALRIEAQKSFEDVQFYTQELDGVYKQAQAQRQQALRQQAVEAVKVLADPKTGIEGWSETVYNDIRHFAISNGLNADVVNELTDPVAIKMLHKAMLFDKGQKALGTTKKIVKTQKKIMKSGSSETVAKSKPKAADDARNRLAKSGKVDDASDLFLAQLLG